MPRKYEMKRRAERMEETRRRITEAAVELHETVGPARTTVSAIAQKAGVQRHTYYAHFPELKDLYRACMGHRLASNPCPSPPPGPTSPTPKSAFGSPYRRSTPTSLARKRCCPTCCGTRRWIQ